MAVIDDYIPLYSKIFKTEPQPALFEKKDEFD